MKFINKFLFVSFIFLFASCGDFAELDFLENPNEVAPENANADDLFNNIQLQFENYIDAIWFDVAGMSRMLAHTGAFNYLSATAPTNWDFEWEVAYARILQDAVALEEIAAVQGLDVHSGATKVLQAYILTSLVDIFGDVPYTEALQGTDIISPKVDNGADIYAAANGLLDAAIAQLSGTSARSPVNDLFYGGSASGWLKAATTMKLRNAVTARLAGGSSADVLAAVNSGNLISSASDDFQFNYGNQRTNPNSRHPDYNNMYENADGNYMSNYYMWLLAAEKGFRDPRTRYYFYRKTDDSVGQDVNVYSCHFSNLPDQSARPDHYEEVDAMLPYCYATEDGYFGRDHLNNEGIPPDGPFRTAYGLYPSGGQFDDESFQQTQQLGTTGGLGQGIQPLMLSSFVDFLRAEAALEMGTGEDARMLLESGIRASMAKVRSFESLVPNTLSATVEIRGGGSATVAELYSMTDEDIDEYVAFVLDQYDNASDKLNVVMKEYYIALWGNGLEAYNMWRRTGKPNNMAPSLEPNPGGFIRTFFYPSDFVNRNATVEQKSLDMPVFWDTNPAGFAY
ncbi:MAG: SusD/RagB family nutrient-binding outer membrane lipoprotein [Saprospiraceae bacterium]|nr:SusD/RagB family nutrient-binding outer membrane lipoprotein [Saprospiraceae bacterium]